MQLAFDDLAGRLQQIFAMPKDERANPAIKRDLLTRLLYQPVTERNLFLADIAKTQALPFERMRDEFAAFEAATLARRKAQPHKPLPGGPKPARQAKPAPRQEQQQENAEPQEEEPPLSTCIAQVKARPVDWLWPDFIPSGSATLLSGDPGSGKTWFALDVAARVSKGTKWIDGCPLEGPANTIYLSIEDDPASAIRPRFDSLGGDPARLFVYSVGQAEHLDLSTGAGLDRLEREVQRIGNVKLVVLDPVADFSGDMNPNAGPEVRALLGPLIGMAARLGFALLLVGHLNKSQSMSAIYRAAGATSGWLGICRCAFLIFRNVDDHKLRHVVALKANYAHDDPPQLEFRLKQGQLEGRVSVTDVDIDEQLAPKHGRPQRQRLSAEEWLKNFFADRDTIPATEIEVAADKAGISFSTLKNAKREGGYTSKKGPDGKWLWGKREVH